MKLLQHANAAQLQLNLLTATACVYFEIDEVSSQLLAHTKIANLQYNCAKNALRV